jgi:antitoxin (DNA-binding transcriptional repressor) of toxin-antitoxin stability system
MAMPHHCTLDQLRENLDYYLQFVEQGIPVEIFRDEKRVAILQPATDSAPKPSFWQAIQTYRQAFNIAETGLDDDFANLRDPGPGRDVDL